MISIMAKTDRQEEFKKSVGNSELGVRRKGIEGYVVRSGGWKIHFSLHGF